MKYHKYILSVLKNRDEDSVSALVVAWAKDNPGKSKDDFKEFLSTELTNYKSHCRRLKMVSVKADSINSERVKKPKKKTNADSLDKVVNYIAQLFTRKNLKVEVTGDYRRGRRSVTSLSFIFTGATTDDVAKWIEKHDKFTKKGTIVHGKHKLSMLVTVPKVKPFAIEFIHSTLKSWGAAQLVHTGSNEYVMYLRMLAKKKRMKLNQYGLWRGDKLVAGSTEESIFSSLKLDYTEPKDREITKMN